MFINVQNPRPRRGRVSRKKEESLLFINVQNPRPRRGRVSSGPRAAIAAIAAAARVHGTRRSALSIHAPCAWYAAHLTPRRLGNHVFEPDESIEYNYIGIVVQHP